MTLESAPVLATVWSDYICPWAYLGRDRTALMQSMGVSVTSMPFELHPELPPSGRDVRPDGRLARLHDEIERLCAEVGVPFVAPAHIPNSRRALETAEVVRAVAPGAFGAVDEALFRAHFVEGRDIGDPAVLDDVLAACGLAALELRERIDRGEGSDAVTASIHIARDHGIAATPAWLFGDDLVVPGAQPRAFFERIVSRLRARSERTPSGPGTVTGIKAV
jgi:predicted DsbA family dithiol-disulfide isomerase